MNIKRNIIILLIIAILAFIFIAVRELMTATPLTKQEMTNQVETMYQAKVHSLIKQNSHYIASFEKEQSVYEVRIHPITGEVSKLQAVHIVQAEQQIESTKNNNNPPTARLTEQQAIDIARSEVNGVLDSVDFKESTDGGHYFIEMDQEDLEITVQIHAITGEILLIEYED
ncbi:MAG: PepSY domain-containing protein [Solibacillus sp.]|uniref:PepSY domain-containing protein n=1 Tax=unclassified Solibacillus TaxID=2637870 RepID=UPI0030F7D28D